MAVMSANRPPRHVDEITCALSSFVVTVAEEPESPLDTDAPLSPERAPLHVTAAASGYPFGGARSVPTPVGSDSSASSVDADDEYIAWLRAQILARHKGILYLRRHLVARARAAELAAATGERRLPGGRSGGAHAGC
jgi:hypothetical protein